jgi:hypothetical protein
LVAAAETVCSRPKEGADVHKRGGGGDGIGGLRVEREKAGLGKVVAKGGAILRAHGKLEEGDDGWTSPKRVEGLAFALERRNGRADKKKLRWHGN